MYISMEHKIKVAASILVVICLSVIVLSGCTAEADDGTITLRVVMEASHFQSTEFLYSSALHWKFKFEAEHKSVNVVIEQLPKSGEERGIMMERIRAESMAGDGPDVLLLPTSGTWELADSIVSFGGTLISDVNHAMYNGIFADISEYYDADVELGKENLVTAVMDAGVVGDKRFVLPLRYDMPVAYVDLKLLEEAGFTTDIFNGSVTELWDAISQSGNSKVAAAAHYRCIYTSLLNFFPALIDYQDQEVLLSQDDLVKFIQSYQSLRATQGSMGFSAGSFANLYSYTMGETSWINSGYCMNVIDMDCAIQTKGIATAEGVELGMFPLRAIDGSLVAEVTYYGAVSAGSEHPDIAYDFLRYFLSEDAQWEMDVDVQFATRDCFSGDGWPVRAKGSVPYLSYSMHKRINNIGSVDHQLLANTKVLMFNDEDVPIVNAQIDHARFPLPLESTLHDVLSETYDITLCDKKAVDLEALAERYVQQLEWHLGEG